LDKSNGKSGRLIADSDAHQAGKLPGASGFALIQDDLRRLIDFHLAGVEILPG
jgi:hypothetical protein